MERLFSLTPDELDAETPILGSSRACGNYVPSILGTNVFNYGLHGSGMHETLFQLNYFVTHKQKGLVIVNLDPWGFRNWDSTPTSGFAGNYRLAALRSDVRDILPLGLVPWQDWMPGFRFQGKLRNNLTAYVNAHRSVTDVIDRGAALLKNSRTPEEWRIINAGLTPDRFVPPPTDAQRLIANFEQSTANGSTTGLTIVWVVTPCSSRYRGLFENQSELEAYLNRLPQIKSSVAVKHLAFDFFDAPDFTDSDFTDHVHLNIRGAEKFTRQLKEALSNFPALPQKRAKKRK